MSSVIPYNRDTSVVLRHENRLVVYDAQSRQLALRPASTPPAQSPRHSPAASSSLQPAPCAYCHRPSTCPFCDQPIVAGDEEAEEEVEAHVHEHSEPQEDQSFINPEYFRLLQSSNQPATITNEDTTTVPGSPRRRIPSIADGSTPNPRERPTSGRKRSSSSGHGISEAAFSPNYFERFFVTERELGRGGKGVVLLVRHVLDNVSLGRFACKRVPIGDDHEWLEKVLMEVQLLQQISHTNLVSYRHVWLENVVLTKFGSGIPVPCAFILQQYCNAGDLHNYVYYKKKAKDTKEDLKDRVRMRRHSRADRPSSSDGGPRVLPFNQIISFFRDIASGLNYLHSNGFIHRDLKPSNCLLNDPGIPGAELKVLVSDFGEVQMENTVRKSTGATGTISYCAPEVLQRVGPHGELGNFSTKSDIFSLGMILHFMCFGRLPYISADQENEENEDLDHLRAEISSWVGFDDSIRSRPDLHDKLYKSLKHLLSRDPNKRPSASNIILGMESSSEFTWGDDKSGLKRGMSPKPQETNNIANVTEEPQFSSRISPVADSSPVTPTSSSPASSISRGRTGLSLRTSKAPNLQRQAHRKKAPPQSKLRDIFALKDKTGSVEQIETDDYSSPNSADTSCSEEITTANSTIILRPRAERNSLVPTKSPLLSPALIRPPPNRIMTKIIRYMPEIKFSFRIILFFGKITSLVSPCIPVATNPWVFYSLLTLALVDLIGPFFVTTAVLLAIHVLAVIAFNRWDMLCLPNTHTFNLE